MSLLPIKSFEQNKIIPNKGDATFLFVVRPPDLEQMDEEELENFFSEIHDWINNLNPDTFVRLLCLDGELLLHSNMDQVEIPHCETIPADGPFKRIFQADDFFAEPVLVGDTILVNSVYYRLINLYSMPPSPELCELMRYGNLVINLRRIAPEKAKTQLHLKRKMHLSNLTKNIRDIESESSYGESEQILEGIIHGTNRCWILRRGWRSKEEPLRR